MPRGKYPEGTLVTLVAQPVSANDKVDWTGVIGKDDKTAAVSMDGEARVTLYLFRGTYNPIATPWLGLTPTPTPAPDLGPATGFIDSLQARVLELQFFESAEILLPGAPKVYSQTFSQFSTRYIYWELGLIHPATEQPLTLEISAVYYRSDGSIFREQTVSYTVETGDQASTPVAGAGSTQTGNWGLDAYRVDLVVDGALVASEGFQVTE